MFEKCFQLQRVQAMDKPLCHWLYYTLDLKLQDLSMTMDCFWTFFPKHKQNKQANSFALLPFKSVWMVPRKLLFIFSVSLTSFFSPLLMESETEDCNSLFFSPSCCYIRFKSHYITATTWWYFALSILYRFTFSSWRVKVLLQCLLLYWPVE